MVLGTARREAAILRGGKPTASIYHGSAQSDYRNSNCWVTRCWKPNRRAIKFEVRAAQLIARLWSESGQNHGKKLWSHLFGETYRKSPGAATAGFLSGCWRDLMSRWRAELQLSWDITTQVATAFKLSWNWFAKLYARHRWSATGSHTWPLKHHVANNVPGRLPTVLDVRKYPRTTGLTSPNTFIANFMICTCVYVINSPIQMILAPTTNA